MNEQNVRYVNGAQPSANTAQDLDPEITAWIQREAEARADAFLTEEKLRDLVSAGDPAIAAQWRKGTPEVRKRIRDRFRAALVEQNIEIEAAAELIFIEKHGMTRKQAYADAYARGRADGSAIVALPAPGFEKLRLQLASDPKMTVEAAGEQLLRAAGERAERQAQARLDAHGFGPAGPVADMQAPLDVLSPEERQQAEELLGRR